MSTFNCSEGLVPINSLRPSDSAAKFMDAHSGVIRNGGLGRGRGSGWKWVWEGAIRRNASKKDEEGQRLRQRGGRETLQCSAAESSTSTIVRTIKNHPDDPHSRFWSTCTDVQPRSNPQRDGAGCLVREVKLAGWDRRRPHPAWILLFLPPSRPPSIYLFLPLSLFLSTLQPSQAQSVSARSSKLVPLMSEMEQMIGRRALRAPWPKTLLGNKQTNKKIPQKMQPRRGFELTLSSSGSLDSIPLCFLPPAFQCS